MIIGALWYSPVLFGNAWMKLINKKPDEIDKESANKAMSFAIIPAALSVLVLAVVLACANATTIADALVIATLVSAGFIGTSALNLVLFEGRSFLLSLLNTGYSFVSLNIAAVILIAWK
jgi:hypothetical protein